MIRRDFLKNAGIVLAGAVVLPEGMKHDYSWLNRPSETVYRPRKAWYVKPGLEEAVKEAEDASGYQYEYVYAGQEMYVYAGQEINWPRIDTPGDVDSHFWLLQDGQWQIQKPMFALPPFPPSCLIYGCIVNLAPRWNWEFPKNATTHWYTVQS